MSEPIKPTVALTLVTATEPKRLTKGFKLQNGELQKAIGGVLIEGEAEVREVKGPQGFARLLLKLGANQALVYGVPKIAPVKLVTKDAWLNAGRPEGTLPRTAEMFDWTDGPGVMMLDYDPGKDASVRSREELVDALREAVSGLADAVMMWWPSASSFIKNRKTGELLRGLQGQRLYLLVADAKDIPRAGKVVVESLWAHGHGYFEISKSGALLSRTLVDATVWQTNRLDFAAGASCKAPLYQDRGKPVVIPGTVEVVNTAEAIPDPSPDIRAKAAAARDIAQKDKKPEAEIVRERWADERVEEMVNNPLTNVIRDTVPDAGRPG